MKKPQIKKKKKKTRRTKKVGLPPGSLVYQGSERTAPISIHTISYGPDEFREKEHTPLEECVALKRSDCITWYNIEGLNEVDAIGKLGKQFNIHKLVLEDILNTEHSPKVEVFEDNLFFTLKMISLSDEKAIEVEQVSIILGGNYVISFQERKGDVFEPIRERLRSASGRIRSRGADYLLYALVDVVVDNYFLIIDSFGDLLDELEDEIFLEPHEHQLKTIQQSKRDLITLRKSIFPLRESVTFLEREESNLVSDDTTKYFRDVYDHIIHVMESIDSFRELNAGLKDIYLSSVSNRMNEVMKTLTIMATIFIPLTFIAGVYGMNFEYMPELSWRYSYFVTWGVMIAVAVFLVIYFKRKHWF